MYGMHKTTVYVPHDLKRALARTAAAAGQSEAQFIRAALRAATQRGAAPRPRLPLFRSGKPTLARRIEKALAGFGEP
jgi:hypothetical protein